MEGQTTRPVSTEILNASHEDAVVPHQARLIYEGAKMFENGVERPRLEHQEDVESDSFFRHLGYALAMAMTMRRRIANML